MLVALADARARYPIPDGALHDLVAGGLQDTEQSRYADFDELLGYCRRVAGAVGVACVAIYGSEEVGRAETLGVAMTLAGADEGRIGNRRVATHARDERRIVVGRRRRGRRRIAGLQRLLPSLGDALGETLLLPPFFGGGQRAVVPLDELPIRRAFLQRDVVGLHLG